MKSVRNYRARIFQINTVEHDARNISKAHVKYVRVFQRKDEFA